MAVEEKRSEFELRDYLTVIRRRKAVIILAVLLVEAAALTVSYLKTPVYQGTAEVLLRPRTDQIFGNSVALGDPKRALETEIRVLKSAPVKSKVREQLGSAPTIDAGAIADTDVIKVQARSVSAKQAADIANAYATSYIDLRREQAVDALRAAADKIGESVADLNREIAAAPESQRDGLIQSKGALQERLQQLRVEAELKSGGAELVTGATVPASPVEPKPVRSAVLGALVGLMLGVGLAFLVEYLDDSVKTKDDFEREVGGGVPVIGLIPSISTWRAKDDALVVSISDPRSPAAEAYRTLRTSIQFLALDQPMRTLQVTSANAREGKTTTLVNLGVSLAKAGQRVVIVCCDLRRPRVHDFFGLSNETGLTSVLLGKVPLTGALQDVPDQNRLMLLASGPLPPNPSELLSSKRTIEVLTSLQNEADIVLLDSPPVLPVTDALVLSGRVDATLLVAVSGSTTIKEVGRAAELLRQVDAPLVGLVLNGVDEDGSYGYGSQYYRYEKSESGREAAKRS